MRKIHRKSLVSALAAGSLLVSAGTAFASPSADTSQDLRSPDATSPVTHSAVPSARTSTDLRSPDTVTPMTRSVYQSTSDRTDLRSPDAVDPYNGVPVSVVSTPVTSFRDPGFDWADAGIGAAALLALALLGFGATLVTRRTHGHAIG